jgi:hypothetical protein
MCASTCILKRSTRLILFILSLSIVSGLSGQQAKSDFPGSRISILWKNGKPAGSIEVSDGKLSKIKIREGRGDASADTFRFKTEGEARLDLFLQDVRVNKGSGATIVSVRTKSNPFSFLLRDVNRAFPIFIPEYSVAVCPADDNRTVAEIERDLKSRNLKTKVQCIENEHEETFDSAAERTRNQQCPIWLGIGRDIRNFEISSSLERRPFQEDLIKPLNAASSVKPPGTEGNDAVYGFTLGRGQGVEANVVRRLEDGSLPILHTTLVDDEIQYRTVGFVSLERSPLTEENNRGSHFLVADYYSYGHTFTPEQEALLKPELERESGKTEETVFCFRAVATNTGSVPRYAWFKIPKPGAGWGHGHSYTFDEKRGFSQTPSGRVFCVSSLDGAPPPQEETAVLLMPGETATFEFLLPHSPIPADRAAALSKQTFDERQSRCRRYWSAKLERATSIRLPEKRVEEMLKAGLLHLDLITYGLEPGGTLAPCIGVYSPIGTESSPIIQFYDSMGLHDEAARSLMYFLDKQHDDGMIQNFGGYMVETGAALWSMGEHFRYTRDTAWVRRAESKILKSCDYLIRWRGRSKTESLRGRGYGMIDGKVADPEDPFHQFMLNGYGFLGLSRAAETLAAVNAVQSARLEREAAEWKKDIRESFFNSMARSPAVPLGDGTWCPTAPPWTEAAAPRALTLKPEPFFSHGTFTVPDALLGPLYLVFCEVLSPQEQASVMMLKYHGELLYQNNAAFSQPYYSRHDWLQLKLGMTKPFLKTYYNAFSALADRETYTFWEHLYQLSVHKTHEEAWFLMATRWMLYMEDGDTLRLLPGIPRKWMNDGGTIELKRAASYFGPFDFKAVSDSIQNRMEATVRFYTDRMPQSVAIRLPHPENKKPVKVSGGRYDAVRETVTITPFSGSAKVVVEY